jgi:hypothetical protein
LCIPVVSPSKQPQSLDQQSPAHRRSIPFWGVGQKTPSSSLIPGNHGPGVCRAMFVMIFRSLLRLDCSSYQACLVEDVSEWKLPLRVDGFLFVRHGLVLLVLSGLRPSQPLRFAEQARQAGPARGRLAARATLAGHAAPAAVAENGCRWARGTLRAKRCRTR